MQLPGVQIATVEVGDLEFTALAWAELGRQFGDCFVVEVKPRDRKVGPRACRFFFQRQGPSRSVELNDAEPFWIAESNASDSPWYLQS